jgi:hypothetical protein
MRHVSRPPRTDACQEVVRQDIAGNDSVRYRRKGRTVVLITILIVLAIVALALYIGRGRFSRT